MHRPRRRGPPRPAQRRVLRCREVRLHLHVTLVGLQPQVEEAPVESGRQDVAPGAGDGIVARETSHRRQQRVADRLDGGRGHAHDLLVLGGRVHRILHGLRRLDLPREQALPQDDVRVLEELQTLLRGPCEHGLRAVALPGVERVRHRRFEEAGLVAVEAHGLHQRRQRTFVNAERVQVTRQMHARVEGR